jgi:hypothetical protein
VGPANELAYVKRYGFFDADVVVLVLNSEDYGDMPTFVPLVGVDPSFPDKRPALALQEAITRYALPRLGLGRAIPESVPSNAPPQPTQAELDATVAVTRELIRLAQASGARVILAEHLKREEEPGAEEPGYAVFARVAADAGIPRVDFGPDFKAAQRHGEPVYRDEIHPSPQGQNIMADDLFPAILAVAEQPSSATTAAAAPTAQAPATQR